MTLGKVFKGVVFSQNGIGDPAVPSRQDAAPTSIPTLFGRIIGRKAASSL